MTKPVQKFRAGSVTATVWKNEQTKDGKTFDYFTVAIERSYQDKDKVWQKTSSMRVTDLPKVTLVAEKAYEYLVMAKEEKVVTEEVIAQ